MRSFALTAYVLGVTCAWAQQVAFQSGLDLDEAGMPFDLSSVVC